MPVMVFVDFLRLCDDKAIRFSLQGEQLKINAPKHTLTPDMVELLRQYKPQLMQWLRDSAAAGASLSTALPSIAVIDAGAPLRASYGQEQLWLTHQADGSGDEYHFVLVLTLSGELDRAALEASLAVIVERHEPLRTVFDEQDGVLFQRLLPSDCCTMGYADLSALPAADSAQAAAGLLEDLGQARFDLAHDPMLRLRLVRLGAQQHQLQMVLHHIASDGWSLGVLIAEMQALYARAGSAAALPALPVRYADYAHWQRQVTDGANGAASLAYWSERLRGAPACHSIATDIVRPPQPSGRGGHLHTSLSPATLRSLKGLAERTGTTLFMVLETLFSALVRRHSQSNDIVIGTPVANRAHGEIEGLVGYFVNLLALRHQVDLERSFLELLAQAKDDIVGALRHQMLPFEAVVRAVVQGRSTSHAPLVQIAFTLQSNAIGELSLPGLRCSVARPDKAHTSFELHLEASETPAGLQLHWEYASDLFDASRIANLAEQYEQLAASVLAQAELPLHRHQILGARERHQLLHGWNDTDLPLPALSLPQWFETQAVRTPERIAAVFGDNELSYAQLNARANQLAHYLREQGVQAGCLVGVCIERGLDMLVALLATLKAGGAYVPLDPAYPRGRLEYMLGDARPVLLLTESTLEEPLAVEGIPAFCLDLGRDVVARHSSANPPAAATPDQLAYVIYTSGSTGKPKGVAVIHGALSNLLGAMQQAPGITADDVVLNLTSLSFDIAAVELFLPLICGARVVLASRDATGDPWLLARLVERHGVTIMQATPSTWRMVTGAAWPRLDHELKVICGGEALAASLAGELLRHVPAVWNLYGPTETTIWSTAARITDASTGTSIGRPIANTRLYILDNHGQLVPAGAIGELYIGGAGLARGYLHRPELSAERFVPDPFAADPAARLYRTGDLARYRPDGNVEYLGRIDHQIKIRGFRIELGEIESQLAQHPDVSGAAVIARQDDAGEPRLVAYVTPAASGAMPDSEQLRVHLRALLPEFMVPALYMVLDAFPLTPSGKIDRNALPAPDAAAHQESYVAPRTDSERRLAPIWAALLGMQPDQVSADANFFALGGHSLLAMRLLAEMRQQLGLELSIKDVFSAPTLAALAALADGASVRAPRPTVTPQARGSNRLPASFAQQRLWFIDQFESGSAHYNMPAALRVRGSFDADLATETVRRIIARHEPLRTVFASDAQGTWQIVREQAEFSVAMADLRHLPPDQQAAQLQAAQRRDAATAFDLSTDTMLRASFLRLADDDGVLLFNMHHIASDGWSMAILVREFVAQYEAARAGRPDPLPPLALHYADYAHWQRDWLHAAAGGQLDYWERQLANLPPVHSLMLDRPRPARQSFHGASVRFSSDQVTHEGLRRIAREAQATLFMVLHSAFAVLLARHGGGDDIVIGTPVANRPQKELEGLIGYFVNTLVLRSDCSGNPRFIDHLARTRAVNLDAQANQDVPFEHLVERLKPARSAQHGPLFQILFSMNTNEGGDAEALQLADLHFSAMDTATPSVKFELVLNAAETAHGLDFSFDYNRDLFDAATIERLGRHFNALLQAIVADPAAPIRQLPMLSAAEQQHLLHTPNATAAEVSQDACFHQLFEAQVAATPDRLALIADDSRLSFAQLNARSNQLAHFLREQGVTTDSLVGLCCARGADMIVALLAVMKAGGAYVPLDPAYPKQRLEHMVADSGIGIVLTQSALLEQLGELAPHTGTLQLVAMDDPQQRARLLYYPSRNPALCADHSPHNLAYVIYTSGSTGLPKGVQIEHASLVNLWHALDTVVAAYCPANARIGLNGSLSFDGSLKSVVQLLSGHCVVVLPDEIRSDGAALLGYLAQHAVDAFDCTPAHLDMLIACGLLKPGGYRPQLVLVGGEAISNASWQAMSQSAIRFYNVYGPTECTVDTTIAPIDSSHGPHIGRPIANAQVYVLDPWQQPVPLGVPGELHIGGAGLARGYLNRPELSAERFIVHPFASDPAQRLYKTGDLVRYLADGNLEYLGRIDDQVKIRGYRIELGEIEHQLASHPGVTAAVVLARDDVPGQRRLVAYVTATQGDNADLIAALRHHAQATLPEFMAPAQYVVLDALPVTANGKIDRRALPAPDAGAFASSYVAPKTETEAALAAIWATVLGLEQVGVTDDFFHLGGHSLLAMQLQAKVRGVFQKELKLKDVFEHPNVEAMAQRLDALPLAVATQVTRLGVKDYYHTSFKQRAEWIHNQINAAVDNPPWCYQHRSEIGHFDLALIEAAMSQLIERHETLRTTFHVVDGILQQKVHPPGAYSAAADLVDLSPLDDPIPAIAAIEQDDKSRRFDFSALYPFRIKLIKTRDSHYLVFTTDHSLADRQFVFSIQSDFAHIYQALLMKREPSLPAIEVTYKDYAEWEYEEIHGARGAEHQAYWHALVGASPYVTLNRSFADHHPALIATHRGYIAHGLAQLPKALDPVVEASVYEAVLGVETRANVPSMTRRYVFPIRDARYAALQGASAATSTPMSVLMLGALSILLHRLSQAERVIVVTLNGTRVSDQWSQVGGHMANEILSVARFTDGMTISQLMAATKTQMAESDEHKIYPLAKLLNELDVSHDGLGTARFNFISAFSDEALPLTAARHEAVDAFGFDLELALRCYQDGIYAICDYRGDLFEAASIEAMMDKFLRILDAASQRGGMRIDAIALDARLPATS